MLCLFTHIEKLVFRLRLLIAGLICATLPGMLHAESFHLVSGGVVDGELLNRDEKPRTQFLIRTADGGQIAISPDSVERIERLSDARADYERFLPGMPPTLEGNWKMAEYCRENNLPTERAIHLQAVLEFDPEHEKARYGLGYSKVRDRWVLTEAYRRENGEVRYKGRWHFKQDVAIEMLKDAQQEAQVEWRSKIRLWRGWLNNDRRRAEAMQNFQQIKDWRAASIIIDYLEKERVPAVRDLYVRILGQLPGDVSAQQLMKLAIEDPSSKLRDLAIDQLKNRNQAQSLGRFLRNRLKDSNNAIVNQTALVLARIGDKDSVPALIDALTTKHKYKAGSAPAGSTSASFGGGQGGLSAGGSKEREIEQQNGTVLSALNAMTRKDFGYNKIAWKKWFEADQTPDVVDLRRGLP